MRLTRLDHYFRHFRCLCSDDTIKDEICHLASEELFSEEINQILEPYQYQVDITE